MLELMVRLAATDGSDVALDEQATSRRSSASLISWTTIRWRMLADQAAQRALGCPEQRRAASPPTACAIDWAARTPRSGR